MMATAPAPTPETDDIPERTPREERSLRLRETSSAIFLFGSLHGTLPHGDLQAFQDLRDRLLAAAGHPSDPLEIMLLEQIALAHFNIGRLQFQSALAPSLDVTKAYGYLAIHLSGEFRKTVLALADYRLKSQAYAAARATAPPTAPVKAGPAPPPGPNVKLGTEAGDDTHDEALIRMSGPVPVGSRSRPSSPAQGAHARRAGAASGRSAG